jgi:hypothetical protein
MHAGVLRDDVWDLYHEKSDDVLLCSKNDFGVLYRGDGSISHKLTIHISVGFGIFYSMWGLIYFI